MLAIGGGMGVARGFFAGAVPLFVAEMRMGSGDGINVTVDFSAMVSERRVHVGTVRFFVSVPLTRRFGVGIGADYAYTLGYVGGATGVRLRVHGDGGHRTTYLSIRYDGLAFRNGDVDRDGDFLLAHVIALGVEYRP
jgi:hypothetical protein